MRPRRHGSRQGFTVMEILLGVVLLAVVSTPVALAVGGAVRAYRSESAVARLDGRAQDAIAQITERLQQADQAAVTPAGVAAPASTAVIDFQRALDFVDDAVVWSNPERLALEADPGDPADGLDNDGDGMVDEGRVV